MPSEAVTSSVAGSPEAFGLLLDRVHLEGEANRPVDAAASRLEQLEPRSGARRAESSALGLRGGQREDLRLGEGGGDDLHPLHRVRRKLAPRKQHQPGGDGGGPQHAPEL